jgi:hypothetical protein
MHCGAEVTESSTNKQHHLSITARIKGRYLHWKGQIIRREPLMALAMICISIGRMCEKG